MDIVVIGAGPAGVSAALYAVRAGAAVTVVAKGVGALEKAEKIENYYGFAQPLSGRELAQNGVQGAQRLGVKFVWQEVVSVDYTDRFAVATATQSFAADAVILCTGASRSAPKIPGLNAHEGMGVSYCAVCDAFFYRGKNVAVLGSGEYALHEVQALRNIVGSVTVLTGGEEPAVEFPADVAVVKDKLTGIDGDGAVSGVTFEDGHRLALSGVFVAVGVASGLAVARKIGAAEENGQLVLDENRSTTVPGLYAAGDCTGGMLQVAKAVYEGAVAGTAAVKYVRRLQTKG